MSEWEDFVDETPTPRANGARKPAAAKRERPVDDWRDRLTASKHGTPHATIANAVVILQNDWAPKTLGFDVLANEIRTTARPSWDANDVPASWTPGLWTAADDARTAAALARRFRLRVGLDVVRAAVDLVARQNEIDPIRTYLESLKWDGVTRVSGLLASYFGAERSTYTEAVGRMFLIGAVARALQPGCKLDTMVVLEGRQGAGKSTAVRRVFGDDWTSDTPLDLASKDRFTALRGKWAIEIAELDGFDRHDASRIKAFISSAVDSYRAPYARSDERIPRRCILVGSTNASGYLKDVTGNRRFFPVRCGDVDSAAIAADRDQLWAEAVALYHDGAPWWPEGELVAAVSEEQEARVAVDSWEETIASFVEGKEAITVAEVLSRAFNLEEAKHDQMAQNRVARALVKLGRNRVQRRVGGLRRWVYVTTPPEVVT